MEETFRSCLSLQMKWEIFDRTVRRVEEVLKVLSVSPS